MTLGDLGADVIKVESPDGDDTRRWLPPADAQGRARLPPLGEPQQAFDRARPQGRRPTSSWRVSSASGRTWSSPTSSRERSPASASTTRRSRCQPRRRLLRDQRLRRAGRRADARLRPARAGGRRADEHHGTAGDAVQGGRRDHRRGHRALRDGRGAGGALCAPHAAARASASRSTCCSADLAMLANQSTGWLASGEVPLRLGNDHPSIEPFATYARRRRRPDGRGRERRAVPPPRRGDRRSRARRRSPVRDQRGAGASTATSCGRCSKRGCATRTRADWRDRPARQPACPSGPVQTIDEAFSLAAELGLDVIDETDGVRTVAFPALLSDTPATVRRRPPDLDEHGDEIRRG